METLQGKASDILLHITEGYYIRTFNENGEMQRKFIFISSNH